MKASRGNIVVQMVETQETLPGGAIVIPEFIREKIASHQCVVLDVGGLEVCDDPDECDRPANVHGYETEAEAWVHLQDDRLAPGAWVFVAPRSLVDAGDLTDRRYFCRADDVLGVFIEEED